MREDLHDCVPVKKTKTISPLLLIFVRVDQPNFIQMMAMDQAGTKVGPDQLGPSVRVGSTRIDSNRLGSCKKHKIK